MFTVNLSILRKASQVLFCFKFVQQFDSWLNKTLLIHALDDDNYEGFMEWLAN